MSSPARGSSAVPVDRLEQLNDIEKEIVEALKNCGASLQELSKDNVTKKNAEQTSTAYIKSLQKIESDLLKQINYLSQVSCLGVYFGIWTVEVGPNSIKFLSPTNSFRR